MLILAVDTSGKDGSLALVRFEEGAARTLELVALEGGTFSAQLVPQIAARLAKHNLKKEDVDAFAVASGPGSFTGLRVGLAAIKALAEVLHKPIAAVSRLEAVARSAKVNGTVVAVLDAGRGELYSGIYAVEENGSQLESEQLLTVAELVAAAGNRPISTPDSKLAESLRAAGANVIEVQPPKADFIARLGYAKIQAGQVISAEALDATYIRRSDAEIMKSSSLKP